MGLGIDRLQVGVGKTWSARDGEEETGTTTMMILYFHNSSYVANACFHTDKAHPFAGRFWGWQRRESYAVVSNAERDPVVHGGKMNFGLGGFGVANHVGQALLRDTEELRFYFFRKPAVKL